MSTILLNVPSDFEDFLAYQVKTKGLTSAADYVLDLLRQARNAQAKADLEAKLMAGVESLNRGEGLPMTKEDWNELHDNVRLRHGE